MPDRDEDKGSHSNLRKQAEAKFHESAPTTEDVSAMSCDEMEKLAHELRICQIELQIQNEELGQTQDSCGAVQDLICHRSTLSDPRGLVLQLIA